MKPVVGSMTGRRGRGILMAGQKRERSQWLTEVDVDGLTGVLRVRAAVRRCAGSEACSACLSAVPRE